MRNRIIMILICAIFLAGAFSESVYPENFSKSRKKDKTREKKPARYEKSKYGVNALIEYSEDRKKMQAEMKKETADYKSIKKALEQGELRKGQAARTITDSYGYPVIRLTEDKDGITQWVYKPGTGNFFTGEKIYLLFDKDNVLVDWKVIESVKKKDSGSNV
ncbi:MAG: hypothetical protein ABH883_06395 [Candidatus Omnitrophota bacterium]